MQQIITLLKQNQIYVTPKRVALLRYFMEENRVLDLQTLLNSFQLPVDRTTLFRTLHLFLQKKIILRIPSPDRHPRYVLITTIEGTANTIVICNKCQQIFYGASDLSGNLYFPKGFISYKKRMVIEGVCGKCE